MRPELVEKIRKEVGRGIFKDLDGRSFYELKKFFQAGATLKRINPKAIHLFTYAPSFVEEEIKRMIDLWQEEEISWKSLLKFPARSIYHTFHILQLEDNNRFELSELKALPKQVLLDFLILKVQAPYGFLEDLCQKLSAEELSELAQISEEEFDQLKRIFEFYYYVGTETPAEKLMKMRAWIGGLAYCWTLRTREYKAPKLAECISRNFEAIAEINLLKIYSDPLIEQTIDAYRQYPEARNKIIQAIKAKDGDTLKAVVLSAQL